MLPSPMTDIGVWPSTGAGQPTGPHPFLQQPSVAKSSSVRGGAGLRSADSMLTGMLTGLLFCRLSEAQSHSRFPGPLALTIFPLPSSKRLLESWMQELCCRWVPWHRRPPFTACVSAEATETLVVAAATMLLSVGTPLCLQIKQKLAVSHKCCLEENVLHLLRSCPESLMAQRISCEWRDTAITGKPRLCLEHLLSIPPWSPRPSVALWFRARGQSVGMNTRQNLFSSIGLGN
eukprot:XP_011241944.1 PREDICTED: uncharacterized protein Gm40773 isoform X1 [Mus musculus]